MADKKDNSKSKSQKISDYGYQKQRAIPPRTPTSEEIKKPKDDNGKKQGK